MAINDGSVREFGRGLDRFSRKLEIDVNTLKRKLSFDIFSSIVAKTPFDEGRARSSWNINYGQPDTSVPDEVKDAMTKSQATVTAISKLSRFKDDNNPYSPIFITSSLVYMPPLEDGSSDQAPNGMVALTMEEVQTFLDNAL